MPKCRLVWTPVRLDEFKDEILPENTTIDDAVAQAARRWDLSQLTRGGVSRHFKKRFGVQPSYYLKRDHEGTSAMLKRRVKSLQKELKVAREASDSALVIRQLLHGGLEQLKKEPNWLIHPDSIPRFEGVPTLLLSDIHHGEVVLAGQVNHANTFNPEVSRRRIRRIFESTCNILDNVFPGGYPGVVVAMAGDMVSGNIHEELRETNALSIFETVLDLSSVLIAGISLMREKFGNVYVPCVVGNHGRLDRKPRCKFGPQDNYEYILYHIIARHFQDDPQVTVNVSEAFTLTYKVYDTRFLLTHGDQLSGGTGLSGPVSSWALSSHKLKKQLQSIGQWSGIDSEYDIILFGHFHRYFSGMGMVCNGSIKGFDEYAQKMSFEFEAPCQALWFTTPDKHITFATRVFAETKKQRKKAKKWVSIMETQ